MVLSTPTQNTHRDFAPLRHSTAQVDSSLAGIFRENTPEENKERIFLAAAKAADYGLLMLEQLKELFFYSALYAKQLGEIWYGLARDQISIGASYAKNSSITAYNALRDLARTGLQLAEAHPQAAIIFAALVFIPFKHAHLKLFYTILTTFLPSQK